MSNVQVAVRCRGRNQLEISAKSQIVVELADDNYSITEPYVTLTHSPTSTPTSASLGGSSAINKSFQSNSTDAAKKTYKFDQIYGSQADQCLIYSKLAQPLLKDFLNGLNVTILAYGQTGTGKTYTMCGDCDLDIEFNFDSDSDFEKNAIVMPENAGIIPRLLWELFGKLTFEHTDFMVRISYLEIYKEELIDLLLQQTKKLRIIEQLVSSATKQTGNPSNRKKVFVQNLTESCVNSYQEAIQAYKMAQARRKTSATNMNDKSSRSHAIFGIQLYKKDPHNDVIYKVSKMNLVDLAGSENISRSGSMVKEAGGINQSLLTLGRVINALNDSSGKRSSQHIPFRDSKLTHILQESLGGNTKTTLIATISPAHINSMETCSTLDYAAKAKNIKNTPQNGHDSDTVLKRTLLKNMSIEISQLNLELEATRNKNGIFLEKNRYYDLHQELDSLRNQLREKDLAIELLTSKCNNLTQLNLEKTSEVKLIMTEVENQKKELSQLQNSNDALVELNKKQKEDLAHYQSLLHTIKNQYYEFSHLQMSNFIKYVKKSRSVFKKYFPAYSTTSGVEEEVESDIERLKKELYENFNALANFDEKNFRITYNDVPVAEFINRCIEMQDTTLSKVQHKMRAMENTGNEVLNQLRNHVDLDRSELIRKKRSNVLLKNFAGLKDLLKLSIDRQVEEQLKKMTCQTDLLHKEDLDLQQQVLENFEKKWKQGSLGSALNESEINKSTTGASETLQFRNQNQNQYQYQEQCRDRDRDIDYGQDISKNTRTDRNHHHQHRMQQSPINTRRRTMSISPKKSKIPTMKRLASTLLDDQTKRQKVPSS